MEMVNPVGPGERGSAPPPPVLDAIDVTALGKRTYEETKTALEWHAKILKYTNVCLLVFTLALVGIPAYLVRVLGTASGSLFSIFLVLAVSACVNVFGVLLSMCGQRRVCHE